MKFPGSKLLHRFDLGAQRSSLEELLRSSRASGFTGLVEVVHEGAIGLIFYYLGAEVNALYRAGGEASNGQAALQRMRDAAGQGGATVSVFELPLDLAYLMRGLTKRQRLADPVRNGAELADLLHRLEKTEHTGTLETQAPRGSAVVLLVRGRVSNAYFESAEGVTYEQAEARAKLEEAAAAEGLGHPFLGDFSREAWKSRHEVEKPIDEPPAASRPAGARGGDRGDGGPAGGPRRAPGRGARTAPGADRRPPDRGGAGAGGPHLGRSRRGGPGRDAARPPAGGARPGRGSRRRREPRVRRALDRAGEHPGHRGVGNPGGPGPAGRPLSARRPSSPPPCSALPGPMPSASLRSGVRAQRSRGSDHLPPKGNRAPGVPLRALRPDRPRLPCDAAISAFTKQSRAPGTPARGFDRRLPIASR